MVGESENMISGNKSVEIMKAASSSGNNNAYNASNSSASVCKEDSSDESIDINRDLCATKKKKIKQMHEADDGIVSQNNVTVRNCGAPDLVLRDSADNMIKSTTQNSGIVISESGTRAVPTKVDDEKIARRRQSNRESAKRSRMRKQEEFKKLQASVEELKAEGSVLKNDMWSLYEKLVKIKDENESMMVELGQGHRGDAISYHEALMPRNFMNGEGDRREEGSTNFQIRYSPPSV